jgi:hypothetical protein
MKILWLALLAGGATCGAMQAGNRSAQPELEFTVLGGAPAGGRDTAAVAAVEPGAAVLEGVMSAPNPCYELGGALSAEGSALTLTITATAMPRICAQVVTAFRYRARIHPLAPGEYRIRVRCQYPRTGWQEKEYDLQVEIGR